MGKFDEVAAVENLPIIELKSYMRIKTYSLVLQLPHQQQESQTFVKSSVLTQPIINGFIKQK